MPRGRSLVKTVPREILTDAARTIAPRKDDRHGPLPPLLLVLTVVTGLVDAVSYLRLGHVFVANMTGNVVFLGFGLAGAADVSVAAAITATLAFYAGAVAGGWIGFRFGAHRGRLLAMTVLIKVVVIAAAVVVAAVAGEQIPDFPRYTLIALLAISMGLQNAAARRIAVPDLTTTVLTLTLTGLAADSRMAGGSDVRAGRRLLAIVAMLFGAALGGVLVLNVGVTAALAAAAILLIAAGAFVYQASTPQAHWATNP